MYTAIILYPGSVIPTNKMNALMVSTFIYENKNAAVSAATAYIITLGYQASQCHVLVAEITGEAKAPEVEYIIAPLNTKELK